MITIYGASDDLVEVEGCEGADEFNVYGDDGKVMWRGDFVASDTTATSGQLRVYAIYDGCWHFSVGQVDEDMLLPGWVISVGQRHDIPYSAEFRINAPEGTRLVNVWPKAEG